jgi:hypothetical protein
VVYHTQDYLEPGRHRVWQFFERAFARRAGTVLSNEVNRGRFMASSYGLDAMPVVIPTALPLAWSKHGPLPTQRASRLKALGIPADPGLRLVLHQGPYTEPGRCGSVILDAFALLPRHIHLAFTGNESEHRERLAWAEVERRPGLKGRVHFIKELSYADLLKATHLFDLGLLLYPNDGVGNFYQCPGRLTEYLGGGLPIVTSRFPGLELLVLKLGLGRACDPASAGDIARAVQELAGRTRAAIDKDRVRLRKVFEERLSYDHHAGLLESTLLGAFAASDAAGGRPRP